MERKILHRDDIKRLAMEAGFDLCGVTRAEHLPLAEERFRGWLSAGYGDGLDYLHRNLDLRFDASKLVDGAQIVIVCGVNYKSEYSLGQDRSSGVKIASYALMRDYHKSVKGLLKRLLRSLQEVDPMISGRCFTDSAPLLEKALAVRAGLGWIGRQSLLVTPQFGTFVLLGELVLDCEVDSYDFDIDRGDDPCGSCRNCIEACPAQAINSDRTLDTRRCIACRTIEHDSAGDEPLSGWIFGCDICQQSCPHNQCSPLSTIQDMQPIVTPPTLDEWREMCAEGFARLTQGTPLKRSSLERVKHNVELNCSDEKHY